MFADKMRARCPGSPYWPEQISYGRLTLEQAEDRYHSTFQVYFDVCAREWEGRGESKAQATILATRDAIHEGLSNAAALMAVIAELTGEPADPELVLRALRRMTEEAIAHIAEEMQDGAEDTGP